MNALVKSVLGYPYKDRKMRAIYQVIYALYSLHPVLSIRDHNKGYVS